MSGSSYRRDVLDLHLGRLYPGSGYYVMEMWVIWLHIYFQVPIRAPISSRSTGSMYWMLIALFRKYGPRPNFGRLY